MRAELGVVLVIAAILTGLAVAVKSVPADTRPQANTIECRDAQIEAYRELPMPVYGDFGTAYEQDNAAVAEILAAADRLEAVCR